MGDKRVKVIASKAGRREEKKKKLRQCHKGRRPHDLSRSRATENQKADTTKSRFPIRRPSVSSRTGLTNVTVDPGPEASAAPRSSRVRGSRPGIVWREAIPRHTKDGNASCHSLAASFTQSLGICSPKSSPKGGDQKQFSAEQGGHGGRRGMRLSGGVESVQTPFCRVT